jgi:hypothetical protein
MHCIRCKFLKSRWPGRALEYSKMATTSNVKIAHPQTAASRSIPAFSRNALVCFLISIFLIVPCLWHAHIEAGDLGSHVYNAWLAELVHQGRSPGVYVVWQWDNVLFDSLLLYSAKAFGFAAAEKVAVSLSVLIFFWGVFAFLKVVSGKLPWFLAPLIGMLSYGYIFHTGFMNYYLSLGLACIGLSFAWPLRKNGLVLAAILAPIMLLAHPLGFLWFLGTVAYRFLWQRLPGAWKFLPFSVGLLVLIAVHWVVAHHAGWEVEWRETRFWHLNGTDQFHVFGPRYGWFTRTVSLFVLLATGIAFWAEPHRIKFLKDRQLILEFYVLCYCATTLLPENLRTDPAAGWIGFLDSRLTLITAILLFCWLATVPARSWYLPVTAVCGAFFFTFLYQDTGYLNRMEANAERVTQQLPFGTRVLASIFSPNDYRTIYSHIPDRACIGHCFLFSNYEPSTGQFRVRVQQGSPVVTASVDDSEDMQSGIYDVQDEDLPLKQIYQGQASDLTQICIRDLSEDEKNGRLGYNPNTNPAYSQSP